MQFGRKQIFTDVTQITKDNVIKVLQDALIVHEQNRTAIKFLLDYERGIQPIDDRIKEIRPEINIKVKDNMAAEITEFKLGYEWGSPIRYVQRANKGIRENNKDADNVGIAMLNEMMEEENKPSADQELARFIEICGVGYRLIKAKPEEIFFTSGGSESDNWVIKNVAAEKKEKGKHVITSKIEHHAVLRSCEYLEKLGYELTYLDVDAYGVIDLAQLREVLREDTTLVSVMTGNNEIGTIEPLDAVASMLRGTGTLFHTDAVQAIGQIPLSMNQLPVDYLSASAHKFHGPKGVGFLFVRKDRDLPSYIHGGSQENGKRAGTENVAGIVGMAKALEIAVEEMQVVRPRIVRLRNYFVERVLREIPQGRLNGHPHKRLPGNVNFSFEGIDATSLLVLLEEDGICASAGSACNTGQTRISHVIEAIHVPKNYAPGSVRFTMGRETDRRQVDAVIASLKKNIGLLRGE